MALLIAGVVLWTLVHLVPAVAPGIRAKLAKKLGEGAFKGLFALDIVFAIALIIFGWKSATPVFLYTPPLLGNPIPAVLVSLAVLLFVSSSSPNNLRRYVRHPQMLGVIFWSAGHLLTNGDSRSVVFFGGFAVWAALEILFINKRDGVWQKPDRVPFRADAITALIAVIAIAALLHFHMPLFGVSPIPA